MADHERMTWLIRCRRVLSRWQVVIVLLLILAAGVAIDSCLRS